MSKKNIRAYRDTASYGKRREYYIIAELLRRGYDVYQTLVDDQQIDCIVRQKTDTIENELRFKNPNYVDIQIKARSNYCSPKDAARFAAMTVENPRDNYLFIFYSEQLDRIWIIPSLDIVNRGKNKIASKNETGENAGKYSINMAGYSKNNNTAIANGPTAERFSRYEGEKGFTLLDATLNRQVRKMYTQSQESLPPRI